MLILLKKKCIYITTCGLISGKQLSLTNPNYSPPCHPPDPLPKIIIFNKLHLDPSVGPCRVHSIVCVWSVCVCRSLWKHERGWKGNYGSQNLCALWCCLTIPACLRQTLIGTSLLLCCVIHLVLANGRNGIKKDKSGQPLLDDKLSLSLTLFKVSFYLLLIVHKVFG